MDNMDSLQTVLAACASIAVLEPFEVLEADLEPGFLFLQSIFQVVVEIFEPLPLL